MFDALDTGIMTGHFDTQPDPGTKIEVSQFKTSPKSHFTVVMAT